MDPERRKTLSLILLNNGFYFMNNFMKRKRQRKRRSCWVKEWFNRHNSLSAYKTILSELRQNNAEYFRRYLRMNTEVYEVKRFLQRYYHYYKSILLLLLLLLLLNTLLTNFFLSIPPSYVSVIL